MVMVHFKRQFDVGFKFAAKVVEVSINGEFPISVPRQIVAYKELATERNVSAGLPAMPKPLEIGVFVG